MIEINGNFWAGYETGEYDALVCTTNLELNKKDELVMGAGIAKGFRDNFPQLSKEWGTQLIVDEITRGECIDDEVVPSYLFVTYDHSSQTFLIGLPTKIKWKNPSPVNLVGQSLSNLLLFVNSMGLKNILMTKPGCGLGGLSWEKTVKPMMIEKFDNRFHVIENKAKQKVSG